jgi:hypothetical protein
MTYKTKKEKLRAKRQRKKDTDKQRNAVLLKEKAKEPARINERPYTYADEAAVLGMSLLNVGMGLAKKKRMAENKEKEPCNAQSES